VTILPVLVLDDDRTEVVQHVTRISGREAALALTQPKDLGERIVVGHGKHLLDQGHEVYVVIDDRGGQILASAEGLTIFTVEDLLTAAVELGILTKEKAQTVYKVFIPLGSGLPTWKASTLRKQLQTLP
jgi:hypothetical protein